MIETNVNLSLLTIYCACSWLVLNEYLFYTFRPDIFILGLVFATVGAT